MQLVTALQAANHFANFRDLPYAGPRVAILDRRYNYALPARDLVHEPLLSIEREALVHIHYNSMFDTVAQWLEPQLVEAVCS